jgi:hypothetical protein
VDVVETTKDIEEQPLGMWREARSRTRERPGTRITCNTDGRERTTNTILHQNFVKSQVTFPKLPRTRSLRYESCKSMLEGIVYLSTINF